jgi:hypothetical protein
VIAFVLLPGPGVIVGCRGTPGAANEMDVTVDAAKVLPAPVTGGHPMKFHVSPPAGVIPPLASGTLLAVVNAWAPVG